MSLGFFAGRPGGFEILIVLIVILLLFGGKKLPELARALGKSLSEFRKGREEGEHEEKNTTRLKTTAPEDKPTDIKS